MAVVDLENPVYRMRSSLNICKKKKKIIKKKGSKKEELKQEQEKAKENRPSFLRKKKRTSGHTGRIGRQADTQVD